MANTPSFNWETPDDTDLVKDGALAIRTLGNAIDASMTDLKGGTTGQVLSKTSNTDMDFTWVDQDDSNAIQNAIVDAKGDLITATAADTPARLAVGTNGQVLTADSTTATGLKWATSSSGGMTLISSSSPTGVSTVTFSSIPSTYKHLLVSIKNLKAASVIDIGARINGNTATDYVNWNIKLSGSTVSGNSNSLTLSRIRCGNITASATNNWRNYFGDFYIYNYTETLNQVITGSANADTGSALEMGIFRGLIDSQAAVTSLTIFDANSNNFTGGTIYLYGVA